jgi:hypothetical protein
VRLPWVWEATRAEPSGGHREPCGGRSAEGSTKRKGAHGWPVSERERGCTGLLRDSKHERGGRRARGARRPRGRRGAPLEGAHAARRAVQATGWGPAGDAVAEPAAGCGCGGSFSTGDCGGGSGERGGARRAARQYQAGLDQGSARRGKAQRAAGCCGAHRHPGLPRAPAASAAQATPRLTGCPVAASHTAGS